MTMIERDRYVERSPFFWIGKAVLTATLADTSTPTAQRRSRLAAAAAKVAESVQSWKRRRRHQRALLELNEMEDWQLRDIGVTRSAVEDALFSRK